MKNLNAILVPVDFSEHSKMILRQAADIARYAKAQLIILHTYHKPLLSKPAEKLLSKNLVDSIERHKLKRMHDKMHQKYQELYDSIPTLNEVHTKFLLRSGYVVNNIIKINETEKIDLILMGTRGVHGVKEFLSTKTADICMQLSTPVLVVPYRYEYQPIRKIAFAYDLKMIKHQHALQMLKLFSMAYNAEIHIITITKNEKISDKERENLETLKKDFAEFNPIYFIKGGKNVEKEIYNYLRENDISMLGLLHRDKSLFSEILHGSMTKNFSLHSDIPLLALDDRDL